MLTLRFARSVASMSFALRFSILPLIDSIMHLAFQYGVEADSEIGDSMTGEHVCEIVRSAINLHRFSTTKYFETELQRQVTKPRTRKTPDL